MLAALGVAIANVTQVSQPVGSTVNLTSPVQVLSSGDLGLWHDREKTNEVTSCNSRRV